MRIVTDTNTVVSGLLWQGPPRWLIDRAREQAILLYTSPVLLAELTSVLGRKKFEQRILKAGLTADGLVQDYARLAEVIQAPPLPQAVSRDPDDDRVLACAIASQADAIVSGDDDLLSLGSHQGILILTAVQALERIDADTGG